jgi:hypothetical protein
LAERRRAARRHAQDTVGRLTDVADEELACGLVRDLSATGICMLLDARVEPGTLARVVLTRAGGAPLGRLLRVVRLSRLGTGEYALGAQFVRPLDAAELLPFVA